MVTAVPKKGTGSFSVAVNLGCGGKELLTERTEQKKMGKKTKAKTPQRRVNNV